MTSVILRIAARTLTPLLSVASLFLLLRGHNAPGGGFIGGLLAATAIALYAMAFGPAPARRWLRITPRRIMAAGLLVALSAGVPALLSGEPFLSAQWMHTELPFVGALPLGTPLWFDLGIFLAVIGFVLTIFFALVEAGEEYG
jgi:multicomponent Na+:H+ antiporter subunit B